MMKISDEMREFVMCENLGAYQIAELRRIADRIDEEMVELPKDKDGVPIHVRDLVYMDDGRRACVVEIDIKDDYVLIDCWDGNRYVAYPPSDTTHNPNDSWERIADELEEWCDSADVDGDACGKPRDLADRIRKLAEKEGKR